MKMLIGDNIKRLRKEKNITQEQLAEILHLSCTAVSKWERGETLPDITQLQPLAYYFGVSVDTLLGYDEEKIRRQIDERLDAYRRLCQGDYVAARPLIAEAYREFPNDERIMSAYMWNIAGNAADNDPAVLRAHEAELNAICDRLLASSTDEHLRRGTWTMRGKILHAKGQTDEALGLIREHLSSWYQTAEQISEQLFAKDTPEFLYWAKSNAYELASFCADKFHKAVFFDRAIPYETRVARIEAFADAVANLRQTTGEFFWAAMEKGVMARLLNDLLYREGKEEDILRVAEKVFTSADALEELAVREGIFTDAQIAHFNSRKNWIAAIEQSRNPHHLALWSKPAFAALLEKYR